MLSYCVKEKIQTNCVAGSEKYVRSKNNRLMMQCRCASCGIVKSKFVKSKGGSFDGVILKGLAGIGDLAVTAGRDALSRGIKSDFAKKKIKSYADKYIDQGIDMFTKEMSKKIAPSGGKVDIHKMIGYLPKPKGGFTPLDYKYMGPYNPLDQQLEYNKTTGEITKYNVRPKNHLDKIAANHDVCYDMGKNKGDCDKQMVKSIDQIPWKDKPWGSYCGSEYY